MQQKIFITGGSGLLALNWALTLCFKSKVTLCCHKKVVNLPGVRTTVCALDSVAQVVACLEQEQPNIVVHAAGLTSVEECEKNPELAEYINVNLAKNVATACSIQGVKLVHISTDHLFDGSESMLIESTACSPLNVYGETKAKAEEAVYACNNNLLIITTNFYGWGTSYRHSFSDFIIRSIRKRESIRLFEDVFFTPIIACQLVKVVHMLVDNGAYGIFNVVGDERTSKYQFGIRLASVFCLEDSFIRKIKVKDNLSLVNRPLDMSLSNRKVRCFLNDIIGGLDKHFDILIQQENDGVSEELIRL